MSSFIDQQEITSPQVELTTVETAVPPHLKIEDSEEESRFQPILHHEPDISSHLNLIPESLSTQLDAIKVRNGGVEAFSRPWLPPSVKKLLEKAKKARLSTSEMIRLMETIADRTIEHFDLPAGMFAAITFSGKITEVADKRLDLLKKIHGRKYEEEIFVWRIGSETFSGRI